MPYSPLQYASGVIQTSIKTHGKAIDDTIRLTKIITQHVLGMPTEAEITLLDGDMPNQSFPVSDSGYFDLDNPITALAGYDDREEVIFEGKVMTHAIAIPVDKASTLVVSCIGLDDQGSGDTSFQTSPRLRVTYGMDLNSFHSTLYGDGRLLLPEQATRIRTWNQWMQDRSIIPAISGALGHLTCKGTAMVKTGELIEITGVGWRFNGNYLITSVRHIISNGDWLSELHVLKAH